MLSERYTPTTQKSLFHKNIINHIRKWIVYVESCAEDQNYNLKHLLLVTGPVGCGKSISMSVLLKGFNVIDIDPNEVRSSEKITELANSIPGFGERTLTNIEKWNHKNKKDKPNVVVVDNIELCDKTISNFVDTVHYKRIINVPIILIGNDPKYNELFNGTFSNYTHIQFYKPSLLELTKLATDINKAEKLCLDQNNIKSIVKKSEFDVRQVFHILDQWKMSGSSFDNFISSIKQKHVDIDLDQKIACLLDTSIPYDNEDVFKIGFTEPLVITNGIYQNYITALEQSQSSSCDFISTASQVMEELSIGNVMQTKLFEEQCWDMYDNVAVQSTIFPSFVMKRMTQTPTQNQETHEGNKKLVHQMTPFKDVSYNYMNSFAEVKQNCFQNHFNPKFNKPNTPTFGVFNADISSCFEMVKMLLLQINMLTEYFDTQKRGKNTSKQEKLDICNNITDDNIKTVLDKVVDTIYTYHLFEIDIDNVIFHKAEYTSEDSQKTEYTKIDLRMFKRFLNIFSFHDTTKCIKPHIEVALKYKLFQKIVSNVQTRPEIESVHCDGKSKIERLTVDLSNIWKC